MDKMKDKPTPSNSASKNELDKLEKQFEAHEQQIKDLTLDRMNAAPKLETEEQTKMSQNQIANAKDIFLKPTKAIGSREKFNEKYREEYNFQKENVYFIAENNEIIGETLEFWTKPFPGMAAEYWNVPCNKPVWAPRYVAERIKGCSYHRMSMDENKTTSQDNMGNYYGQMVVDNTVQRLDARPASKRKSIFMGAEF